MYRAKKNAQKPKSNDKESRLKSKCRPLKDEGGLKQYQLKTIESQRSPEYCIKKLVCGVKKFITPQYSILLVGGTGSGKSTCVDALVNFFFGVKFTDAFRLRIVNREMSSTSSQRDWITCYTIYPDADGLLPFTLNIIDTPGFGDTRGVQHDKHIVDQMKELFKSREEYSIDNLHAVGFVVQSSCNHLTASNKYIFSATLGLFGKEVEDKFSVFATHSDSCSKIQETMDQSGVKYNELYLFNSEWLQNSLAKEYFKDFEKVCQRFFNQLRSSIPCSLATSADVLMERAQLQELVQVLSNTINSHVQEIVFMRDKSSRLTNITVDTPSLTKNMNCPECRVTCKYNVGKFESFIEGIIRSKASCPTCSCLLGEHMFENKEYCAVQKIVSFRDAVNKQIASQRTDKIEKVIDDISTYCQKMEDKITDALSKLKASIERLNTLALKPQLPAIEGYFDILIANELWNGTASSENVQELKRLKSNIDMVGKIAKSNYDTNKLIEMWK